MVSLVNQFMVFSGTIGPTVNPSTFPSATASVELTNEVIWILQAGGY